MNLKQSKLPLAKFYYHHWKKLLYVFTGLTVGAVLLGHATLGLVIALFSLFITFACRGLPSYYLTQFHEEFDELVFNPGEHHIERLRVVAAEVGVLSEFEDELDTLSHPDFQALNDAFQRACQKVHGRNYEELVDNTPELAISDNERSLEKQISLYKVATLLLSLLFVSTLVLAVIGVFTSEPIVPILMLLFNALMIAAAVFFWRHHIALLAAEKLIKQQNRQITEEELRECRQHIVETNGNVNEFDGFLKTRPRPLIMQDLMRAYGKGMGHNWE